MNSYRDILRNLYYHDMEFRRYVSNWCFVTGQGRAKAFENADVQRRGMQIVAKREENERKKRRKVVQV